MRKTRELVAAHPLSADEVVEVVLDAWERILDSTIAGRLQIGVDVKPSPQMMGNFLESVMVAEFTNRYPDEWREQRFKHDKDLVYVPDEDLSTEIKTSSHRDQVFGNRSYAQPTSVGTKDRDGYYITVNFEGFAIRTPPQIRRVQMGWLSHADWKPQASATGQQASIALDARRGKLLEIYPNSSS